MEGLIKLTNGEKLKCQQCFKSFSNQTMVLKLTPSGRVEEVLCEDCHREDNNPQSKGDTISFDVVDFGKIIFDLIELGASVGKEERAKR